MKRSGIRLPIFFNEAHLNAILVTLGIVDACGVNWPIPASDQASTLCEWEQNQPKANRSWTSTGDS
eukprot:1807998-Amphidinium_carterae.1